MHYIQRCTNSMAMRTQSGHQFTSACFWCTSASCYRALRRRACEVNRCLVVYRCVKTHYGVRLLVLLCIPIICLKASLQVDQLLT